MNAVILKKGRESSLYRNHPWVFSGAIQELKGNPVSGETVDVLSFKNEFLAKGSYSPKSQMTVRVLSFDKNEIIDENFFYQKIKSAKMKKELLMDEFSNSYRVIFGESDGLPGLIIDKYNHVLVCQFLSAGAEYWKEIIVQQLINIFNPVCIYERSDADVRKKEGLGLIKQSLYGELKNEVIEILENGCKYFVDVINGHKTGFYLDQKVNRALVGNYAENKNILNCFSYTGGFSITALNNGAVSVTNIDSSSNALKLLLKNCELNNISSGKIINVQGNVFNILREYVNEGKKFDVIILDPPKLVESAGQLTKGARAYKDLNMTAFKLLNENGILFTFSCSGLLSAELFQKIVFDASADAKINAQIIGRMSQSPDHGVSLNFPEAWYLKGLVCRV
ncbi:MAG: class I SAM-dependent methyltransferase [Bacteroidetes bacterium]|nr:class I SAM-dependent methyltransferase [Bacteroidota bacterium]